MSHTAPHHAPVDDRHSSEGGDDHISRGTYIVIFVALMIGLVLTMVAWMIPFHTYSVGGYSLGPLGIVIAFVIASIKAILVVLYFMHVRYANRLTKIFVFGGLFWLAILIGLTLNDYVTRAWLPMSRGWNESPTVPPPASVEAADAESTAH